MFVDPNPVVQGSEGALLACLRRAFTLLKDWREKQCLAQDGSGPVVLQVAVSLRLSGTVNGPDLLGILHGGSSPLLPSIQTSQA
jgi:hypothetical protein